MSAFATAKPKPFSGESRIPVTLGAISLWIAGFAGKRKGDLI